MDVCVCVCVCVACLFYFIILFYFKIIKQSQVSPGVPSRTSRGTRPSVWEPLLQCTCLVTMWPPCSIASPETSQSLENSAIFTQLVTIENGFLCYFPQSLSDGDMSKFSLIHQPWVKPSLHCHHTPQPNTSPSSWLTSLPSLFCHLHFTCCQGSKT